MSHGRQAVVFGFLVIVAAALGGRLYVWQVLNHANLSAMAQREHFRDETIAAKRGSIYDAAGNVLATNEAVDSVYAARAQVEDVERTARVLSPLLELPEETIKARISDERSNFMRLKGWVSGDVSRRIREEKLLGIILEPDTRRVYAQGSLAAHVLGFTNQDGAGQYGLEEAYNQQLAGTAGHLRAETDTAGRPINFTTRPDSLPAKDGADIVTSIDATLQYIAERELAAAIKKHRATGGTVLIMEPRSGEVLANANEPSFDPNRYSSAPAAAFPNPAISRIFEPGSTFKVLTMSIALAEHVVEPTTAISDPGYLSLAGIHITNWNGKGHSPESATQVLQYSSNVGAATIGWKVGAPRYYPYIKRYGLGQLTGIDLAGEVAGQVLYPEQASWTPSNLVTNSFGQGIAVTPLQLVSAMAAIANGGVLMQPRVVKEVRESGVVRVVPAVEQRRVLESDVAATLTKMLVDSAKIGEAQLAVVPGFQVAAKTGTAQVASPTGGYAEGKFIASLLGFAPADNPRFAMLVKIDEPQDVPFGSEVAAPVWNAIAKQLFVHYRIQPSDPEAFEKSARPSPVAAVLPAGSASAAAKPAAVASRPGTTSSASASALPKPSASPRRS